MPFSIPVEIERVLVSADESRESLDELKLWQSLKKAWTRSENASAAEKKGAFSEIAAWEFMRSRASLAEPWGIYWTPMMSGVLGDGKTPFYEPDVALVDDDILTHWIFRATNAKHPVIRARYADLVWDIGCYIKRLEKEPGSRDKPLSVEIPVRVAQIAIDSYIDTVESALSGEEFDSWEYLERAIQLSIALRDETRTKRVKSALFAYHRSLFFRNENYHWMRLADIADGRDKALQLTEEEQAEITESLEAALRRYSDISDKKRFDPHQAIAASDRLVKRFVGKPEDTRRVVKQAGSAFERIARDASALLAISWLEDLIPRYRQVGLVGDAARVEGMIRALADAARGEMKQVSATVEIPSQEFEKWVDDVVGHDLSEALSQIGWACVVREQETKDSIMELKRHAPLLQAITIKPMGVNGFTEATIGSIEDDPEGRAIKHAADSFGWNAPFLDVALGRMKEKHGFELNAVIAHLEKAPIFAPDRSGLLREGLAAWSTADPVKAIHVLVPQVEAACRDLLALMGAPVMKHYPQWDRFEVIGMGAVLHHAAFRAGVLGDVRFHLKTLYSDPRGVNLRNHLAHGIAHTDLLNMGLANWVVHSIFMLALVRPAENGEETEP